MTSAGYEDRVRGCLLGGALGDAFGYPVEFWSGKEILARFGAGGLQEPLFEPATGWLVVSDDTQMTMFTLEGLLLAAGRSPEERLQSIRLAYLEWLDTQGGGVGGGAKRDYRGWLAGRAAMRERRAPGNTCLSALRNGGRGTPELPINHSKGCGGVMRVAPAGLFYPKESAFRMAAEFAALTHGHSSGYLSAGALAYLIASIIEGQDIQTAVQNTLVELEGYKNHDECMQSLKKALDLSGDSLSDTGAIAQLGEGWVGEEALAISVYCALKHRDDFRKALIAAVNHNGDSDSTGAITGNIVGAYLGLSQIPEEWIENIELKEVLMLTADDLCTEFNEDNVNLDRYPLY